MMSFSRSKKRKKHKKIIYVYNSASYLYRFRAGLMLSMKARGWDVIAAAPYDAHAKKIVEVGIRFRHLPFKRQGRNPLADLWLFFRLAKFYSREKPMIVHHFTIKPVIYGTLAARMTRIPGVVNLIPGLGYVFSRGGLLQRLVEVMYRFSLSSRVRVIFQNHDDLDYFIIKRLVRGRQTHLICGSGIDTDFYSPDNFPRKEDPLRVTFTLAARMLWDKGVSEFVEAAKYVNEKDPRTHFLLVGAPDPGNPMSVPVSWLEDLQDLDFLEWTGHTDDIRPFLARTSVAVLPSYREGAPRVLLEAAAMARPIIATDVPGCREIVTDGQNGILVPEKDTASLAQAMLTLAGDPARRRQMGSDSRRKALETFDERLVIRKTLEVYGNL